MAAVACGAGGCGSPPAPSAVRPSAAQDPSLAAVEFGLSALGDAQWDGFTMPVVANDGSAIALQADSVPDWSVRLGTEDAPPSRCGTVIVHGIGSAGLEPAVKAGPDLLLGRCWIDGPSGGPLVERPLTDGGRGIGVLSTVDGHADWLLDDGAINSGAWAVPDRDRILLTWCRRAPGDRSWSVDQAAFDRSEDGWVPCAEGAGPAIAAEDGVSWSGPCMIDGLLTAIQVRDGVLRLMAFDASPARSEPARVRNTLLTMRGTREVAWQCVTALGPTCLVGDSLSFLHPRFSRLATWSPRGEEAPTLLPEGTTGLMQCGSHCLWSTGDRVWACRGSRPDVERRVLVAEGTWILLHGKDRHALLARPQGRALRIFRLSFVEPAGS